MPISHYSKSSLRQQLIQGVLGSIIIRVARIGLNLFLAVILARLLGKEGFGTYSFCLSVVNLLTIAAMFGSQTLLVREVATYITKQKISFLKGLLQRIRQASTALSISIASFAAVLGYWLYQDSSMQPPFLFSMALVPAMTAMNLQGAVLRGLNKVLMGQINMIFVPGLVIVLVIFFHWSELLKLNPESVISMYIISAGSLSLIYYFLIHRILPKTIHSVRPEYDISKWCKSLLPFFLSGSLALLNTEASVVLLGSIKGPEETAIFRVAQRGAELVAFGLLAVNMTIGPTIAELYTRGEKGRLQHIINKSNLLISSFAFPSVLIMIFAGKPIISIIFGKEYLDAYIPLVVLSLGQLFNACMGPVGLILNMVGSERIVFRGITITTIANLILNLILILFIGANGAAIANSTSIVILNSLLVIWLKRKTKITSSLSFKYYFRGISL